MVRSIYLTLVLLLSRTTGEISNGFKGHPQILSFTAETWTPSEGLWKSSTDLQIGNQIRLICTIDDASVSGTFQIRKLNETTALEPVEHPNFRQTLHKFVLDCDKTGTYVCEDGRNASRTMDLSVFDCSPQIQSFTSEVWVPSKKQWKTTTDIERGKDIRLICTVKGSFSENFRIRKLHATNALAPLDVSNPRQIIHEFRKLDCDKTGTYVCEDANGVNRTMDLAIFNCSPRMPILSFTFEEWDPFDNQWKSSTEIESGEDIRLICTIDGPFPEKFTIKKLHETNALVPLEYPKSRQIAHVFRNVSCDKMGTYICENGEGARKTIELGIFNCEPSFCDEKEASTTAVMGLMNAKVFSVCVLAFPDLNVAMAPPTVAKHPAETEVSARNVSNISPTEKETADQSPWVFEVEPKPNIFGAYSVLISTKVLSMDDYGEHSVIFSTTHKGQRKELKYSIVLHPFDSLACPTKLEIINSEVDRLRLSWRLGLDRIYNHGFQVIFSKDGGEWVPMGGVTNGNSIRLTGLEEDTQYAFKVIPAKESSNSHRCKEMVLFTTAKSAKPEDAEANSGMLAIVLCGIGIFALAVIVALVLAFLLCGFRNRNPYRPRATHCCTGLGDTEESLVESSRNEDV